MRSEEEEQSLKPDLRQPWICIVSNSIFLALAYYETVAVLSHRRFIFPSITLHFHCTHYSSSWVQVEQKSQPKFLPWRMG